MTRRWMFAMIAVVAMATTTNMHTVRAEADCIPNDGSCIVGEGCPVVCCSGMPPRFTSGVRFCITPPTLRVDNGETNAPSASTDPSVSTDRSSQGETTPTPESAVPATSAPVTEAPAAAAAVTPGTDNVNAFQSTSSISNKRGGPGSTTTMLVVIGAVGGCVILVAAVMYKKKTPARHSLEIPGSSYHGAANGAGLTPDNRSLDGMLGEGRATTDSMKQLPVLSMASRPDASIVRLSSPFGNGGVRISSPAHRGGSNEDYAFAVDTASRAGSTVNVAFVESDVDIVVQKNGVVAL